MRRLLLRDASARFGAAATLVLVPLAYLWRSWPPWDIRMWLHRDATAWHVVAIVAGYVVLTLPVARLLLASNRLEYWRAFPISPRQWTRLHTEHLVLLNLPGAAAAVYLLAPLGMLAAVVGAAGLSVAAAAAQVALVGRTPASRRTQGQRGSAAGVRRAGAPVGAGAPAPRWTDLRRGMRALARLYILALWRRDRPALAFIAGVQFGLVAFAVLGVQHVAADEPAAAWPLLQGSALGCSLAGGWAILRAQRGIDRDRWYLDAIGDPGAPTELVARVSVGVLACGPAIAALGIAAPAWLRASATALAIAVWAASMFTRIGARAEVRRRLTGSQHVAVGLGAAYGVGLLLVVGALAFPFAAAAEIAIAYRSIRRAAQVRARFETTAKEDDHE